MGRRTTPKRGIVDPPHISARVDLPDITGKELDTIRSRNTDPGASPDAPTSFYEPGDISGPRSSKLLDDTAPQSCQRIRPRAFHCQTRPRRENAVAVHCRKPSGKPSNEVEG